MMVASAIKNSLRTEEAIVIALVIIFMILIITTITKYLRKMEVREDAISPSSDCIGELKTNIKNPTQ